MWSTRGRYSIKIEEFLDKHNFGLPTLFHVIRGMVCLPSCGVFFAIFKPSPYELSLQCLHHNLNKSNTSDPLLVFDIRKAFADLSKYQECMSSEFYKFMYVMLENDGKHINEISNEHMAFVKRNVNLEMFQLQPARYLWYKISKEALFCAFMVLVSGYFSGLRLRPLLAGHKMMRLASRAKYPWVIINCANFSYMYGGRKC